MIVVDTNIIAYLYLPNEHTAKVEQAYMRDPEWVAPLLWRSELRSILSLYTRKEIVTLEDAIAIQEAAEEQLSGREYTPDSITVLSLAAESGCSAYDCEFVALAQALNCSLLTHDRKLLKAFPTTAITPG